MKKDSNLYDVIVIGAGSAGLNIGIFCAKLKLRVLIIDKSAENVGGDCLNFGCIPSKALLHVARTIEKSKEAQNYGLEYNGQIDIKSVMRYIRTKVETIRARENPEWLKKQGLEVILGEARFSGINSIKVDGEEFFAKKIFIATGSRPRKLKIPGLEYTKVFNNENIFKIDFLPKNFTFVGGGPISCELGQAFASFGSNVTIIENAKQFLPKEDPEISDILLRKFQQQGINLLFNTRIVSVNQNGSINIERDGKTTAIESDCVFIGIGRVLNTDSLEVEKADIKIEPETKKIILTDRLSTTNPNVFVCGDASGNYQFTHNAELETGVILRNLFTPLKKKVDYNHMAWVTFTDPEIATFGLNEETLKSYKIQYSTLSENFTDDDRAITDNYQEGKIKIFIGNTGKILGGSLIAPYAGEIVQELILAETLGLKISDLYKKTYPYPTMSRINRKLAQKFLSQRLNPASTKLLRWLFRLFS